MHVKMIRKRSLVVEIPKKESSKEVSKEQVLAFFSVRQDREASMEYKPS
jgi:hypothetical protein